MDGVLVDSERLHEKAQDIVCRQFGLDVPKTVNHLFKGWTEERVYEYIAKHFGTGSTTVENLIKAKHFTFASLSEELQLMPGAMRLVQFLHDLDMPLGLVTSATKADQKRAFIKFGLTPYFSSVITIEDVHRPKPDPQPYQITADRLGLPARKCIVVEDSKYGILSALQAGSHVLGLASTFSHETVQDAGAHAVFRTLAEIEGYIRSLLSPKSHDNQPS